MASIREVRGRHDRLFCLLGRDHSDGPALAMLKVRRTRMLAAKPAGYR